MFRFLMPRYGKTDSQGQALNEDATLIRLEDGHVMLLERKPPYGYYVTDAYKGMRKNPRLAGSNYR